MYISKRFFYAIMAFLSAVAIGVGLFYCHMANAAPLVIDCKGGAAWTWNQATATLTCDTAPVVPPVDPPPVTGAPFEGCPTGTLRIDGQWGNNSIPTADWGIFNTNIVSVRVAVPATWSATSVRTSAWAEFGDGGAMREMVWSTRACDFSDANAIKTNGWPARTFSLQPSIAYKREGTVGSALSLKPGTVTYINIRNRYTNGGLSCTSSCAMRGGLPD